VNPYDEGGFIAYIEEIPGINTKGDKFDDAKENLADAINLIFQETRVNFIKSFLPKRKIIIQSRIVLSLSLIYRLAVFECSI